MTRLILLFTAVLVIATAWGMGYRTGRLDADAEIYSAGYEEGYSEIIDNLNH